VKTGRIGQGEREGHLGVHELIQYLLAFGIVAPFVGHRRLQHIRSRSPIDPRVGDRRTPVPPRQQVRRSVLVEVRIGAGACARAGAGTLAKGPQLMAAMGFDLPGPHGVRGAHGDRPTLPARSSR
jgi:hypothetical protein